MTATYSGDPSNSDKDAVRSLVGDTGGSTVGERSEFFLTDDEIRHYINQAGNVKQAGLACAKRIKWKLSSEADAETGDGAVDFSQRVEHYDALISDLQREVSLGNLNPYAGGISDSDKDSIESDTDRIDPFFERGQFDNLRSFDNQHDDDDDDYHHH